MEKPVQTNIIAITDFTEYGNSAVHHAGTLAQLFGATLTVVTNFAFASSCTMREENDEFRQIIANFSNLLEIKILQKKINRHLLHHLAEQSNTIMYVIGVARRRGKTYFHRKRALQFIAPSRLPVMTVGKQFVHNNWQNVLISNDIQRQEKEKVLWAGYFHRFGKATIHLLYSSYTDNRSQEKLTESLDFVDKLYQNLSIPVVKHELPSTIYNLESYAISHAEHDGTSLIVMMTTTYKTLIDILFGTREKHLIANKQGVPILFLNERDDLYVLCT